MCHTQLMARQVPGGLSSFEHDSSNFKAERVLVSFASFFSHVIGRFPESIGPLIRVSPQDFCFVHFHWYLHVVVQSSSDTIVPPPFSHFVLIYEVECILKFYRQLYKHEIILQPVSELYAFLNNSIKHILGSVTFFIFKQM